MSAPMHPSAPPSALHRPLRAELGAPTAAALEKHLHLVTVGDLLRHYPRRYVTRAELTPLAGLAPGEDATVVAQVATVKSRRLKDGRKHLVQAVVTDGVAELDLAFFAATPWQAEYRTKQLAPGTRALFVGRVGVYNKRLQLAQPEVEEVPEGLTDEELAARANAVIPVYPATEKVSSFKISKAVATVLGTLADDEVPDPVPLSVRERLGLVSLAQAFRKLHAPASASDHQQARRRLRFEEAFVLQVELARRRAALADLPASAYPPRPGGIAEAFDAALPFTLTQGQVAVGERIREDLSSTHPMNRLLQGEVGSGKTLVALRAMLQVVDAGAQAALLAPTEVLAVQHHRSLTAALGDLARAGELGAPERATRVTLLTGSMGTAARRAALLAITTGEAGIVVGTHALIQDGVDFFDLGLAVIDEQHRFGVEQRDALRAKSGLPPHVLVMTATPIPRTVAMTVFGDLEVSTLRELPAGRSPISTHVVHESKSHWLDRAWSKVRQEVLEGRQAFVVAPRIGDDDGTVGAGPGGSSDGPAWAMVAVRGSDLVPTPPLGDGERRPPLAAVDVVDELRTHPAMAGLRVELLHGRMSPEAKDAVMSAFTAGEVQVLVATTVVEVGVDVPNATVMVVMDADRFGVSQLHQLRGRIGRGGHPGTCLLVTGAEPGPALERLEAVAATTDGFELARADLEARQEGDVLGASQSGYKSSLRLLRVTHDEVLITTARTEATAVVELDPALEMHPVLRAELAAMDAERQAYLGRG